MIPLLGAPKEPHVVVLEAKELEDEGKTPAFLFTFSQLPIAGASVLPIFSQL